MSKSTIEIKDIEAHGYKLRGVQGGTWLFLEDTDIAPLYLSYNTKECTIRLRLERSAALYGVIIGRMVILTKEELDFVIERTKFKIKTK